MLLFFKISSLEALNAPDMKCLEILETGDVSVIWQASTDLTDFVKYTIYYSITLSGNYTQVAQITDPHTTQYTHIGANAANYQVLYYYIVAESGSSFYYSDTLSTLLLNLNNPANGTAVLSWNGILQHTDNTPYHIYRVYPLGNYTDIKTVNNKFYIDTIYYCDAEIGYQIRYEDRGCFSTSAVRTDIFKNYISPQMPYINAVTVGLSDSLNHIQWQPSSEADIYAYIIYCQDKAVWIPIDTIFGKYHTEYIDTLRNPYQGRYAYRISTLDSCYNTSPMSVYQSNFQLTNMSYDACETSYTLSWTTYENMTDGVSKYQIWCSKNGKDFLFLDEVSGTENTYKSYGLQVDTSYTYVIKAVNAQGSSQAYSTTYHFVFKQETLNNIIYLRYVTVKEDKTIEIAVYVNAEEAYQSIKFYRAEEGSNQYILIGKSENNGTNNYIFNDKNVLSDEVIYEYKAVLVNSCSMNIAESNISKNIKLQSLHDEVAQIKLFWTKYESFNAGVETYQICRKLENSMIYQEVTSEDNFYYEENIYDVAYSGRVFAYCIEAVENPNNEYGFCDRSRSNVVYMEESSVIYLPNAFVPGSSMGNGVFKPSNLFVTTTQYIMRIYNRYGKLVFTSNDPNIGWDGYHNGKKAPIDIYVYIIEYMDKNEKQKFHKGTVTLVQ